MTRNEPDTTGAPGAALSLAEKLAAFRPAGAALAPVNDNAPALAQPAPPPGWTRFAGQRLAGLFVSACDAGIAAMGRRAKVPDDDAVDDLGAAFGESLAQWFPDSELTPFKKLVMASAAAGGSMWLGAPKIDTAKLAPDAPTPSTPIPAPAPPPPPKAPPTPTPATATATKTQETETAWLSGASNDAI